MTRDTEFGNTALDRCGMGSRRDRDSLIEEKKIKGAMIVGIGNAPERVQEYMTQKQVAHSSDIFSPEK